MTHSIQKYICAALMTGLALSFAPQAYGSTDIHMLPPFQFDNATPCSGTLGQPQLLAWDGTNPINCIPGVTGNSSGDLTAVALYSPTITSTDLTSANITNTTFNGSNITTNILKFLSGNGTVDVTSTVVNLTNLGPCPSPGYEALTRQADGTFACIAVTDIVGVGKTVMPSCPPGSQIYFNGTGFICQIIPVPAYPVNCTGANALQFNSATNTYACTAVVTSLPTPPPPLTVSCPAGQALSGISSGTPVCTVIPTPPVAGANPLYVANASYTDPTTWNNEMWGGIVSVWGAAPGTGNVNSDASWSICQISDPTSDPQLGAIGNNTSCMNLICTGHFGKYPAIAQINGQCAAGDSNPLFNGGAGTGVHMIMSVNCEYTQ